MTPKDWACLARDAYSATPNLGPVSSAGRIVFNTLAEDLVLSIPGTNNDACLLADIDAIPHDAGPFGRVHMGIWNAFDPVWPDVSRLSVYGLVGHSEGALGAIYLAARLCLNGSAPKVVHAFDPPKASIDSKLTDIFIQYGVELHIYHHGKDFVPMLAPDVLDIQWRHPGSINQFGAPKWPFPNVDDHMIDAIIADLA